jgi:hypothetical protein
VAVEKHKKDKAERDEVNEYIDFSDQIFVEFFFSLSKADRLRRDKLRRKREEEEAGTNDSSRIMEVTDEEADKITRENAQAKVINSKY